MVVGGGWGIGKERKPVDQVPDGDSPCSETSGCPTSAMQASGLGNNNSSLIPSHAPPLTAASSLPVPDGLASSWDTCVKPLLKTMVSHN